MYLHLCHAASNVCNIYTLESDLSWEVSKVQNCDRLFRHCHLHRKCHLQTFYLPSSEEVPSTLEVPWRCLLPPWYENNPSLESRIESHPIVRSHSDEKNWERNKAQQPAQRKMTKWNSRNKIRVVRWISAHIFTLCYLSNVNRCHMRQKYKNTVKEDCQCATF